MGDCCGQNCCAEEDNEVEIKEELSEKKSFVDKGKDFLNRLIKK